MLIDVLELTSLTFCRLSGVMLNVIGLALAWSILVVSYNRGTIIHLNTFKLVPL